MEFGFLGILFVVGAVMGSFVACQAWRMRYREQGRKSPGKRSVCLKCGHKLKWYENIPILSWVALKGKCSQCGRKIGIMEILAEVLMGLAFVGIGWATTSEIMVGWEKWLTITVPVFAIIIVLGWLAIYDGMWGELPVLLLIVAGGMALAVAGVRWWQEGFDLETILQLLAAVGVLGGPYLILYLVSRGKWVGDGDWILGVIIAAMLGEAWLSLWVLFIANFLGCVISWPKVRGKKEKKVHFGPFMVVAFVIVLTFADFFRVMIK